MWQKCVEMEVKNTSGVSFCAMWLSHNNKNFCHQYHYENFHIAAVLFVVVVTGCIWKYTEWFSHV